MKYKLTFRSERCKGCGLCVEFCPKKLITLDNSVLNGAGVHPAMITDQEACVGCCTCAMMCPDGIITIEKLDD